MQFGAFSSTLTLKIILLLLHFLENFAPSGRRNNFSTKLRSFGAKKFLLEISPLRGEFRPPPTSTGGGDVPPPPPHPQPAKPTPHTPPNQTPLTITNKH